MPWEPILWLVFFVMNMGLVALNLYQIVCLSDLEADYMNAYESSSSINRVVVPEIVLNVLFSTLFLVTGHWFMFLLTLPVTFYSIMLYIKKRHLIDVTEVFRTLHSQKMYRVAKLAFYLFLFVLVIIRLWAAGTFSTVLTIFHPTNEGLDLRSNLFEFYNFCIYTFFLFPLCRRVIVRDLKNIRKACLFLVITLSSVWIFAVFLRQIMLLVITVINHIVDDGEDDAHFGF